MTLVSYQSKTENRGRASNYSDHTWVCKKLQGLWLLFGKPTEVDPTVRAAHCSLAREGELLFHVVGHPPLALSQR